MTKRPSGDTPNRLQVSRRAFLKSVGVGAVPRSARAEILGPDAVVIARPEEAARRIPLDQRTAAVVITHNYAHDLELLAVLLASPVRYVGMPGARGRTLALLGALKAAGRSYDVAKVYSPVGMDIGA